MRTRMTSWFYEQWCFSELFLKINGVASEVSFCIAYLALHCMTFVLGGH